MAALYAELSAMLRKAGCRPTRQGKGSHEIWFSPVSGISFTVPKTIASRHTANAVLKQAGLPKAF
jgi:predicted RNA binding protein YcfA (HicA-like mRNA interferase family)